MQEILLVNPRRKRRKMSALQRKYFGSNPRRSSRKRRSRSRRRSVALAAAPAVKRSRRRHVVRSSAPRRRRSRSGLGGGRMSGLSLNTLKRDMTPALTGAAGALLVDLFFGYAGGYLPAFLTTGPMLAVTRIGAALLVGTAAGAVMGRRFGEGATVGALTITTYSVIKSFAAQSGLPLARYVAPGNRLNGVGRVGRIGYPGIAPDAGIVQPGSRAGVMSRYAGGS